ncbi:hypothetical protein JCM11251_002631 [Rhodosporidiobolus azoricus]
MSWNNGGQPRRSAPLINRPSAAAPPPAAAPSTFSGLSGAIAGALGGMGYAQPQPGGWPQGGAPVYGAPASAIGYPPPAAPPYGGGYGHSQAGVGSYGPPQHYGQNGWNVPPPAYPPPPPHQSAYPPSFYPPSHQLRQPLPPAPAPYASSSSAPYHSSLPQRPQTTEDGYTLSAAYDPSISSSSSPFPSGPSSSRSAPFSNKRDRGGARGGGGGGEPRQANQGPHLIGCSQEGCTFRGRTREVREHEEDRHLIYQPGREPKPWSGSLKPLEGAVIEGTGIALDTPEALAKWIEERKKRWPSKKVVEEKEKAREQRVAAGLEAPPRERGGRGRGRGRGQGDFGAGRGGGRGQGRGGARGGYGGARDAGYASREGAEEEGARAAKRFKVNGEDGKAKGEMKSLDGLSSDSSSSDSSSDSDSDDDDDDSDDGPPEEETTAKAESETGDGEGEDGPQLEVVKDAGGEAGAEDLVEKPKKQFQVVCRHWRKGTCQLGDSKCPYLHEIPANAPPPPPPKRKRPAPPPPAHNPFARPASFSSDPFALLAERDHRHIVSDVLQVIEWLGANEWLKGVEIRPGQVDEESGIEVLGETKAEESVGAKEAVIEEVSMIESEKKEDFVLPSQAIAPVESLPSPAIPATSLPSSLPVKPSSATRASTAGAPPASSAAAPFVPAPPPASVPSSAIAATGLALLADYGSDSEDDEEADAAVAASLVGGI